MATNWWPVMATKCILDGRMPIYRTCVWSLSLHLSFLFDTPSIEREREFGRTKTKQLFHDNGLRYIFILFSVFVNDLCFICCLLHHNFDILVLHVIKYIQLVVTIKSITR